MSQRPETMSVPIQPDVETEDPRETMSAPVDAPGETPETMSVPVDDPSAEIPRTMSVPVERPDDL